MDQSLGALNYGSCGSPWIVLVFLLDFFHLVFSQLGYALGVLTSSVQRNGGGVLQDFPDFGFLGLVPGLSPDCPRIVPGFPRVPWTSSLVPRPKAKQSYAK